MYKITRVVVLVVGLVSAFAAMAGAASASTWTNAGATAFTATSGPMTLNTSGLRQVCTSMRMTGTAPATAPGPLYNMSGTLTSAGCTLSGLPITVTCTYGMAARIYAAGSPARVSGDFTVSCTTTQGCRITGIVPATYTDPTTASGTPGRFSLQPSTGLNESGCIYTGAMSVNPDPWVFRVSAGTGGTFSSLGPNVSQP